MTDEIKEYFIEKYKICDVKVVPGHWPDFKSKEEVNKWIKFLKSMFNKV